MSLVAYDASSDDESDNEGEPVSIQSDRQSASTTFHKKESEVINGHSDDDDDELVINSQIEQIKSNLNLPAPKNAVEDSTNIAGFLSKLPMPKTAAKASNTIEIVEDDDEFLHKKEQASFVEKPPPVTTKNIVKITIPSLAQFKNCDNNDSEKTKKNIPSASTTKTFGLLTLLPKPKSEQFFGSSKSNKEFCDKPEQINKVITLIPDSVKYRNVNSTKSTISKRIKKLDNKKSGLLHVASDSDESETESDFFSLNADDKLPEVSISEINDMVAKRAAKMAETMTKFYKIGPIKSEEETMQERNYPQNYYAEKEKIQFDQNAIQALVGSQAKRRKLTENVQVVELSSAEVLPNKEEWLRSALASETSFQTKGVLVDEEPAPGTRKKHQITYLAHQAKANEAELQAMWAANRQTRRATANKYGF